MNASNRIIKSFSLEKRILKEVERTKGPNSTSERVNQLLSLALDTERNRYLFAEAKAFFDQKDDRRERKAFQRAAIRSLARDED